MFNSSLEKTDVIFMYLFPKAVDRLRAPLSKLPQTTRVISRGFPFTGVIPMRSFKVDGSTFYIYHVKDLA